MPSELDICTRLCSFPKACLEEIWKAVTCEQHSALESLKNVDKILNSAGCVRIRLSSYIVFTREQLLCAFCLEEEEIKEAPDAIRNKIEQAIKIYNKQVKAENTRKQYKISLTPNEKKEIEEAAKAQGYSWSVFAARAALSVAHFAIEQAANGSDLGSLVDMAYVGLENKGSFPPDDIRKAMDVAGISPSQALNIMAELERLRKERLDSGF